MVFDYLSLRLFLSFLIGGSWITVVTLASRRFGPLIGGVLAGIPSTAAFSLLFIGWIVSSHAAVQATTVFPLAFSFTACFPLLYAFFANKSGFGRSMLSALSVWGSLSLILSVAAVVFRFQDFNLALLGSAVVSLAGYYLLVEKQSLKSVVHGSRPTNFQSFWRFILGGSIVASAVLVSQIATPVVGGVFSAFPTVSTSAIFLINSTEGKDASREIATPMMVTTTLTVIPYSVVVRFAYPLVGIWTGTIVGYVVALPLAILAFLLLRKMRTKRWYV